MYIDDIGIFATMRKELEILIQMVKTFSQNIEMKIETEKYAIMVLI